MDSVSGLRKNGEQPHQKWVPRAWSRISPNRAPVLATDGWRVSIMKKDGTEQKHFGAVVENERKETAV